MKTLKNTLLTIAIILLMLVLTALFAFGLASSDVNDGVFTAQPSDDLPYDIAGAVLTDSEYTVSEEQLNSYFAYLLSSAESSGDKFSVTDIYIDIMSDGASKNYIKMSRDKLSFTLTCDCTISIDGDEIAVQIDNASVGKLPLSDALVTQLLKHTKFDLANVEVDAENRRLCCPTHYGIDLGDYSELVSIDILSLTPVPDGFTITTNPIIDDSLMNAFGMIFDYFTD